MSARYRSAADSMVMWSGFLIGSIPRASNSRSCSSLRAAFVAMSHDRVCADLFPSLPHRSHRGQPHRLYCPAFFSLLLGHFFECLA